MSVLREKLLARWHKRVAEQADIYVQWQYGKMTEDEYDTAVLKSERARQDLVKHER